MSDYFKRLSIHPGVPIASLMTLAGAIAGADGGTKGVLCGAAALGTICWLPVLITARTQPLPKQEQTP